MPLLLKPIRLAKLVMDVRCLLSANSTLRSTPYSLKAKDGRGWTRCQTPGTWHILTPAKIPRISFGERAQIVVVV
jgi:hypothetical protein